MFFIEKKERNILFNSKHFFCGYMALDIWKRATQIARGNLLQSHRLLFPTSSKGSFINPIPWTGYNVLCYTSHRVLAGTISNSMLNGSTMMDRSDASSHHEQMQYYGGTSRSNVLFVCTSFKYQTMAVITSKYLVSFTKDQAVQIIKGQCV